jgi:hypothetical protein
MEVIVATIALTFVLLIGHFAAVVRDRLERSTA